MFIAHALMENRNGLLVDFLLSEATGMAERDAVPVLVAGARERGVHPRTLGGDKGYVTWGCVGPCVPAWSPRTWRKTRAGAPALSMDARPGIAGMR